MKKITFYVLGFLCLNFTQAQQKAHYTMYMANPYLINPALAGSEDYVDIKAGFREQWQGWTGNPRTYYLSAHSPIGKKHNARGHYSDQKNWISAGGLLIKDETGPMQTTSLYGTITYNIQITKGFGYGITHRDGIRAIAGLSFGANQWGVRRDGFQDQEELDRIMSTDPTVAGAMDQTQLEPDASFGIWVYQHNRFFFGFSAQQILGNQIDFNYTLESGAPSEDTRTSLMKLNRHYFTTAGLMLQLNPLWDVYPSVMIKAVGGAPVSVDFNAKLEYNHGQYWAGVSYRNQDAINLMIGTTISNIYEIGYSYDITTSAISAYSNGSHEIVLGYRIQPKWDDVNAEIHQGKKMKKHKHKH